MSIKKRIYYHHTDCGGVVYYGNYLSFLEEARTDFLEEKGVLVKDLAVQGTLFVVARQEIDYKFPSFYGDILEIVTHISEISGVRINFEYDIKNQNNQLVSRAKTILVCVDSNLKPKPIPEEIRRKIS
ncbi:MAG: acyl-CoA thioesterase [Candidatus Omnitrophica bacterium]|nr:acyl-CoA thioesterase [Candidatus Omnitrophota bacterium]